MRLELTKRADYAIRASLALARTGGDERRSVRRLALEEHIPARFLVQVMGDLVAAGLVEGAAGRTGGYRLRRSPVAITLLDVVEAVEGDSRRRRCVLRGGPCRIVGVCDVHAVFAAAQDDLLKHLAEATLESVVRAPH
ncbi:MAG TPA: Rrf2 family transcriptional regulator [Candidatus Limnocylindrales bacterium]|nr:Rrf2 family transcriptional regulator [Candidatus Limnocylindrales bacterium]